MASIPSQFITPDEYLRRERVSETKHEYFQGQIYAMAGASEAHADIRSNMFVALANGLRGKPCRPCDPDVRILVERNGLYTYPDIAVVCGARQRLEGEPNITLLNPTLIIEVLSDSTESYDRGPKFTLYKGLVSLTDYVLVSQHEARVEHHHLAEGAWTATTIEGLDQTLPLPTIDCELPLSVIYDGVSFE